MMLLIKIIIYPFQLFYTLSTVTRTLKLVSVHSLNELVNELMVDLKLIQKYQIEHTFPLKSSAFLSRIMARYEKTTYEYEVHHCMLLFA